MFQSTDQLARFFRIGKLRVFENIGCPAGIDLEIFVLGADHFTDFIQHQIHHSSVGSGLFFHFCDHAKVDLLDRQTVQAAV